MKNNHVLKRNLERLAKMTASALNELEKENPNPLTLSNITEEGIWGLVTDGLSVDRSGIPNFYDNLSKEYGKRHKALNSFTKNNDLVGVSSLVNHKASFKNIALSS